MKTEKKVRKEIDENWMESKKCDADKCEYNNRSGECTNGAMRYICECRIIEPQKE